MSPKAKHIPDHARRTTVCLTDDERAAINWISVARRRRRDDRTTINDILVDAIWYMLENKEHKTREEIQAMVPPLSAGEPAQANVTEMPKPKNVR
jgi:hypothetical protein